jgi:hypothetical protein
MGVLGGEPTSANPPAEGPAVWLIRSVACATTCVRAAASGSSASLRTPPAEWVK